MEFTDMELKACDSEVYENAIIISGSLASISHQDTKKEEINEEYYEEITQDTVQNEGKNIQPESTSKSIEWKDLPNGIKYTVYILSGMLIVLYVAVIVVTVIYALPKAQVHGGWSLWSPWGSCSVSCDVGIQRRDRACTNPYPSIGGDHCFGESRNDIICTTVACSDGGWSSWTTWGTCSDTCGVGIRSKTRNCSNPEPSILGKPCAGESMQVSSCNKQTCPEHKIAFTAYGVTGTGSTTLVFPKIIQNYGNGYSNSTGNFTCTVPGIYYFSVQISKKHDDQNPTTLVVCYIHLNSVQQVGAQQDPHVDDDFNNDLSGYSLSVSASFHLNTNDTVKIGGCSGISTIYTLSDRRTSFTGFLVTPDN